MPRLPIIFTPNPILKMKSSPVEKIDKELQKFLDNMLETMYYEDGAGIAAVQVGVLKRIFILDIGRKGAEKLKDPQFYINPEIIECSEEQSIINEGCLSFPGARSMISRPERVKIKFLDYDGNERIEEADDYKARGFLHENDHLNGITMPDHLSPIKRDVFNRQVRKTLRNMDK
jgi:peptide deformylase